MVITLPKFVPHNTDDVYQRIYNCLWYLYQLNQLEPQVITEADEDQFDQHKALYDRELKLYSAFVPVQFTPTLVSESVLPLSVVLSGGTGIDLVKELSDKYASLEREREFIMGRVRAGDLSISERRAYEASYITRLSNYQTQFKTNVMPVIVGEMSNV